MEFLHEFDELERRLRLLPRIASVLPPRAAPKREDLDWWLARHAHTRLPPVYVEFLTHYGGVDVSIPPRGVPLRPLAKLVQYQQRRDAIGETFDKPRVALSCSNIEGELWLWYSDASDPSPRCALDGPTFETDGFAHYLWTELFAATSLYGAPFCARRTVGEAMSTATDATLQQFYRLLAANLEARGFSVLTFDSRRLTAQRTGTSIGVTIRGEQATVSAGRETRAETSIDLDDAQHAAEAAWREASRLARLLG